MEEPKVPQPFLLLGKGCRNHLPQPPVLTHLLLIKLDEIKIKMTKFGFDIIIFRIVKFWSDLHEFLTDGRPRRGCLPCRERAQLGLSAADLHPHRVSIVVAGNISKNRSRRLAYARGGRNEWQLSPWSHLPVCRFFAFPLKRWILFRLDLDNIMADCDALRRARTNPSEKRGESSRLICLRGLKTFFSRGGRPNEVPSQSRDYFRPRKAPDSAAENAGLKRPISAPPHYVMPPQATHNSRVT